MRAAFQQRSSVSARALAVRFSGARFSVSDCLLRAAFQ
jgi:hypothetical protein